MMSPSTVTRIKLFTYATNERETVDLSILEFIDTAQADGFSYLTYTLLIEEQQHGYVAYYPTVALLLVFQKMSLDQEGQGDQDQMLRNLVEWATTLSNCSAVVLIRADEQGDVVYCKAGNTAAVHGALGLVGSGVLSDIGAVRDEEDDDSEDE